MVLQPEEWVRQHCIHYLIETKKYPKSLINVEKEFIVNKTKKRYDIVVYTSNGSIFLIVECKAPKVKINESTFNQIARYNLELHANYIMLTNGKNTYFCKMDYTQKKYVFLKDIPEYKNANLQK